MTVAADRLMSALTGRYRIERELGAGGMATVYLAQDLKHDRDVAIKVLHEDLGATLGPERFLAEIKTTARLQHPHILPLLDSGDASGLLFYVMPFVAGETLRERLMRDTQLSIDEALRIAREVADALGAAHALGIIHRDIKPENILLQGGHALVADFGIALAVQQAGGTRITQTGLSLGTPQYMAPEQAMGEKAIGPRADIYALGAVLYEMLTGEPPFTGPTVQTIVARILTEKPASIRAVRDTVPEHVESAVMSALAKLPADRVASAEEFSRAISTPVTGSRAPSREVSVARTQRTRLLLAVAAVTGAVVGIAATALWRRGFDATHESARPPATFVVASLGVQGVNFSVMVNRIAVTPDGKWIAYVASGGSGPSRVFLRSIDDVSAREIGEGYSPAFSPDSKTLVFTEEASDGMMTVPVSGGTPSRLVRRSMISGSWGVDGRIRYVSEGPQRILHSIRVADGSSDSLEVGGDTTVVRGELLPANRLLLSLMIGGVPRIVVRDGNGRTRFLIDGEAAHYTPTGHLVLTRRDGEQAAIFGVRFDAGTATVDGNAELLARNVSPTNFAAVTNNGDLVYVSGTTTTDRQIVSVDRGGNERPVTRGTANFVHLRLGADGSSLVTNIWDGAIRSIWLVDGATGALLRLTRNINAFGGTISPDARTVYFTSPGEHWTWKVPATGGPPVFLETPKYAYTRSVSRDGSSLFVRVDATASSSIWRVPLGGAVEKAVRVLDTPASESEAHLSPDGRWLAYVTDASGRDEAVLAPMAAPGDAVQISTESGVPLAWSRNGDRLFFRQRDEIWEIGVGPVGAIRSSARRIFTVPAWLSNVEITPDGEHLFAIRGGMIYTDLIMKQGALK
jgi:eukaryotic-like serine/threonine-protein kinase